MSNVLLETKRLNLRRLTEDDADVLFELDNDPEVMRYLNAGLPTPRQVFTTKIFPGFLDYDPCFPLFGFWALETKSADTFLGWVSYRPTDANHQEATLGFRLRKSAWGCGYATEGARAILDRGFTATSVQCVKATTYEANQASQCVLQKLGMRLIRKFRISAADLEKVDTYHSDVSNLWDGYDLEYALTKADWKLYRP